MTFIIYPCLGYAYFREMEPFHHLSPEDALAHLSSSINGLNEEQVAQKRAQYGWNELPVEKEASLWWIFLKQFKNLMVAVLLVAAAISYFAGHLIDVYVILVVVLVNAFIAFFQEIKANKAVLALRKMLVQQARVIRNGKTGLIPAQELVPGDIIVLEEGDSVPADARILQSNNLRAVEASLTGESVPESKQEEVVPMETPMADQKSMVWKGTHIAGGFAQALVCGTGSNTAIGQVAQTLTDIPIEKTNFQKKTDRLARQMAFMALVSTILLLAVGWYSRALELNELLMMAIAVMVSAIPEGLPAVLSIVLAIGSRRMSQRNAIIREITSVETLGAVTTIITDKTGTLTQNKLTVKRAMVYGEAEIEVSGEGWFPAGNFYQGKRVIDALSHPVLSKMIQIAALSNNSAILHNKEKDTYELVGDPTEGALMVMAKKAGILPDNIPGIQKLEDFPFNSKLKLRATLCSNKTNKELLVVGAPEKLLQVSSRILTGKGLQNMDEVSKMHIHEKIEEWSGDALRVIGVAYRKMNEERVQLEAGELIFVGLVGMLDPPRPEVREAVEKCGMAGIRVIMATGDHVNTAISIAKATGILGQERKRDMPEALTEQQLELLDEKEFDDAILSVSVLARLTPIMKLRIADRLQANGELVAMTGDGVNDAPALKKADVGVAMGIMGTDVAREASKMVLADDNFATIVNAVEEGRIVFANARQTSFFLVTTNFAEIITLITLISLGYPMPLTAIQILWLNLVTDGVGDIALATEKGHGDMLEEKPIRKGENILHRRILPFLVIMGGIMTGLCILVYFWFSPIGLDKARTGVFITMAMTQLFNLYNMRSLKKTAYEIGYFTNAYINIAFMASVIIQVVIVEVPFFQSVFDFSGMSLMEFLVLTVMSSVVLWVGELYKIYWRKPIPIRLPEKDDKNHGRVRHNY